MAPGSVILQKAMQWMKKAQDASIRSWRDLSPDPPYLVKFNPKCKQGLMELVKKKPAFKTQVDLEKIALHEDCKHLSG